MRYCLLYPSALAHTTGIFRNSLWLLTQQLRVCISAHLLIPRINCNSCIGGFIKFVHISTCLFLECYTKNMQAYPQGKGVTQIASSNFWGLTKTLKNVWEIISELQYKQVTYCIYTYILYTYSTLIKLHFLLILNNFIWDGRINALLANTDSANTQIPEWSRY